MRGFHSQRSQKKQEAPLCECCLGLKDQTCSQYGRLPDSFLGGTGSIRNYRGSLGSWWYSRMNPKIYIKYQIYISLFRPPPVNHQSPGQPSNSSNSPHSITNYHLAWLQSSVIRSPPVPPGTSPPIGRAPIVAWLSCPTSSSAWYCLSLCQGSKACGRRTCNPQTATSEHPDGILNECHLTCSMSYGNPRR